MHSFVRLFCTGLFLVLCAQPLRAQVSLRDSAISLWMLSPTYSGFMPGADMNKRFGYTSQVGMNVGYKWRTNWYVTGGVFFLFGEKVKETNILDNVVVYLDNTYYVLTDQGQPTQLRLLERGIVVPFSVGKVLPLAFSGNRNSGLYIEAGGQYIQHKIHTRTTDGNLPAIMNGREKGYDRFSTGLGLRQGIGYRHLASNGYANFSVGLDFSQNFTQNRRSVNVDTGLSDTRLRTDLLSGFTISWIFPVYDAAPDKFYYQ